MVQAYKKAFEDQNVIHDKLQFLFMVHKYKLYCIILSLSSLGLKPFIDSMYLVIVKGFSCFYYGR